MENASGGVGESLGLSVEDDVSDAESGFSVACRAPWPSAPP